MTHATAQFNPATITDRQIRRPPPLTVTGLQLSQTQYKFTTRAPQLHPPTTFGWPSMLVMGRNQNDAAAD